jgi:2'-5' RNA ligase
MERDPALAEVRALQRSGMIHHGQAEYLRAWQRFEQLERLAAHRVDWAAWAAGHHHHRLFALLPRQATVLEAIELAQQSLRHMVGVELHPREFFHLTLQTLGFDDQLDYDAEALARVLAREPAFDIQLGGVNAFESAVFLEVHGWGELLALRRHIRRVGGAPLARLDPVSGYLFHLTLGYFDTTASAASVCTAIRSLRQRWTTHVRVDEVALVELPTDQRVAYPPFEPLMRFPLRQSR